MINDELDDDEADLQFLPESQIKQYIREIETNESQFLGTTLREIYEKDVSNPNVGPNKFFGYHDDHKKSEM